MPPSSQSPRKSQSSSSGSKPRQSGGAGGGNDIRSFFGNSASQPRRPAPRPAPKGTGDEPISIDSSDDEITVKPIGSRPAPKPVAKPAARGSATTSKHFSSASSSRKPVAVEDSSPEPEPVKTSSSKPKAAQPRSSLSKTTPAKRSVEDPDEGANPPKRQTPAQKKRLVVPDSESEEEEKRPAKSTPASRTKAKSKTPVDEDEPVTRPKAKPRSTPSTPAAKAAKPAAKDEPKAAVKKESKPAAKSTAKPAAKDEPKSDGEDKPEEKKKFNYFAMKAQRAGGPSAPGSKDIPVGNPGCLANLSFVFTGELESLGRDDAIELAKRYEGRVVGAPSGKTDYVVMGDNAGPSKINKIKEIQKKPNSVIKIITEDEFLDLIRTRSAGPLTDKQKKAKEKEEQKIRDTAIEFERREKEEEKERLRKEKAQASTGLAVKKEIPASAQLWTTKYAPKTLKEVCGNKGQVEKLSTWLADWQKNYKVNFKRPGKDGMGMYRAVLISGPPGIGKTTSAHLAAAASGYQPLELNASDARSKKLVENFTNIDNTSLDGFFSGKGVQSSTVVHGVNVGQRTCLIMDEVDGMSAGDRGGVGALNALIKKTKIPMILICNDKSTPKMKPFITTTANLTFRRPTPQEIRARILSILHKEKLKIPTNVVDELIKGVNSDIRQVLNMLSTYKLSRASMDFDEGKELIALNEKNPILTPFTIVDKLCGPYSFSRTNTDTLADKMELYFHDFSFVPLFVQEHYLKTEPAALRQLDGPDKQLKNLELLSKAADSISDGDLVDRMIHGGEQHWSLLPLHAVTSSVIPAYHIYGSNRPSPNGGWGGPAFPQWLGQNSKQTKLQRQLTDIQIRMRLRVSGSRQEIRQQYMPLVAGKIVSPLVEDGNDGIDEVIETMDEYYLGKDDWDAFVELGVDGMKEETVLKQIPTATKTAFTRQYNKRDHPIAFHKGDMFASSKKKIADQGPAPDNDDVFEEDEAVPDDADGDADAAGAQDDDVNDASKDKLIKAVKPKGKAAAGAKGKGKK